MIHKLNVKNIWKVLKKDPKVLIFRAWQLSCLRLMRSIGYWERLEARVSSFWSDKNTLAWIKLAHQDIFLIGKSKRNAFKKWSEHYPEWVAEIYARAEGVIHGRFTIFDQTYDFDIDNMPWHTDWRCAYTWEPAAYETYRFSVTDKQLPYDVKFPWELSRFGFLFPLAQMSVLTGDPKWQELIVKLTMDWEKKNPLSRSVNWQAMICSIHGISLSIAAQILASDENTKPEAITPLLRQLTLQGEFVFHNIEYSFARGNHYASNLAGLLIIGATIQMVYKPASRWVSYAVKRICSEIELQYYEDGIHFEKSTSYHRLVTEFFLLSLLIMEKMNCPISEKARQRIIRACHYTRSYTRPDGLAANWGDNDGAWLLAFDPHILRDHRALLALASVYFNEPTFKISAKHPSATIPWLLGTPGVQKWDELSPVYEDVSESIFFAEGGMVVSRSNGHFFIADFGEVGKRGLGGHGHNDTFSFELCLQGMPVVVDSGSPIYTGDINLLLRFSGTEYHNTVMVDNEEMAQQQGLWRLSNEAIPHNVQFRSSEDIDIIQGEHLGYTRLSDPLVHNRSFSFYRHQGRLVCNDVLLCNGRHQVKVLLHFAPNLKGMLSKNQLLISLTEDTVVIIEWTPGIEARLEETQVSETFSNLVDSSKLVILYEIFGNTELSFEIKLVRAQEACS